MEIISLELVSFELPETWEMLANLTGPGGCSRGLIKGPFESSEVTWDRTSRAAALALGHARPASAAGVPVPAGTQPEELSAAAEPRAPGAPRPAARRPPNPAAA